MSPAPRRRRHRRRCLQVPHPPGRLLVSVSGPRPADTFCGRTPAPTLTLTLTQTPTPPPHPTPTPPSQIPGVPIMYLAKHRYTIERLPEATVGGAPR
jgi:hypothetical protein